MAALVPITPYSPTSETIEEFLQRFLLQMSDSFGRNDKNKLPCLIKSLPVDIITSIQRRIAPKLLTTVDYDSVEEILIQQYSVQQTFVAAAIQFLHYKQKPEQSIEEYGRNLNSLAAKCSYKQCCSDTLLKQVFIANLRSPQIMSTLLQKADSLSFNESLQKAKLIQQVMDDTKIINTYDGRSNDIYSVQRTTATQVTDSYKCYRCGALGKHHITNCFAIHLVCNHCKKVGHIRKVCRQLKKQLVGKEATAQQHQEIGSSQRNHGFLRASASKAVPIQQLHTDEPHSSYRPRPPTPSDVTSQTQPPSYSGALLRSAQQASYSDKSVYNNPLQSTSDSDKYSQNISSIDHNIADSFLL